MLRIIQNRNIFFALSGALVVLSLGVLIAFGLKPSIDFTSGTLIELSFTGERPEKSMLQENLDGLGLGSVLVQQTGDKGYILRLKFISEEVHQTLLNSVRSEFEVGDTKVREERVETSGPGIISQLKQKAVSAAIAVIVAIVLYVAYAFRKVSKPVVSWKYGVTAIIALLHDVMIVMGIFAVLGYYAGVEVGIPFVVALLTILGYSVNDTIVVFDRIREELVKRSAPTFEEMVNKGVNGTLVRSLNTSLTTLLVLFGLYLFGGDSIHYFALALILGVIFGTYSSIFLASPLLLMWNNKKGK